MNVIIKKMNPFFCCLWDWNGAVQLFGICEISRFKDMKQCCNIELHAVNPVFPNPFIKEEPVKLFFVYRGPPTYENGHN
jgi:hypothetical protein